MIHKLIDTATAATPTGLPTQHKLFRVGKGPYTGRLLALFSRTSTALALSYAGEPYTTWLDPADFITDADDLPFAAVMDDNADVWVAYTQQSTGALRCARLIFANGTWAAQTPVTVYDSTTSANRYPSILKDSYGRVWIAWTRDDNGTHTVRVKSSNDGGQVFGSGATDAGTDLSGSATSGFGLLTARADYVHCLFTLGGTALKNREINLDAVLWNAAVTLYTGTGLGSNLTAAVSADGMLGVSFCADGKLFLKEYDGAAWGALQTVSSQPVSSPSLLYQGTAPYALFLRSIGADQDCLYESHRIGGTFATPSAVLSQEVPFDSVFCLDVDAGTPYADLTAAAASPAGADVYHPTSGVLLQAAGDGLFLGLNDRFSLVRILLSTVGAGGTVTWAYWSGAAWNDFVPDSGTANFDTANMGIRLFSDGAGSPLDWQKTVINGANRYWVRATVGTTFAIPPVGSQITPVAKVGGVIARSA